jgi:hypothetical protein
MSLPVVYHLMKRCYLIIEAVSFPLCLIGCFFLGAGRIGEAVGCLVGYLILYEANYLIWWRMLEILNRKGEGDVQTSSAHSQSSEGHL